MKKASFKIAIIIIIAISLIASLFWFYIKNIKSAEKAKEFKEKRIMQEGEGTVNKPVLLEGMKPIIFEEGNEQPIILSDAEAIEGKWYNYEEQQGLTEQGGTSKWANAITQDGSMWVWIPRYAYKIEWNQKDISGKIDIIFLSGNTDCNMEGNDVTTLGYKVHPAFQNGEKTGFSNGEWDKEITGIWVAKFEAGFAGQKNTASENIEIKNTNAKYESLVPNIMGEVTKDSYMTYPVFMGKCYSYNNVQVGEMYKLSLELTKQGNPYGFSDNLDSHMIKNSEWGAITYLAHSKYGRNGTKVSINNMNISNVVTGACTVTGYSGKTVNEIQNKIETVEDKLQDEYNNKSYVWYKKEGTLGSTTGNLYGIYDMNGACSEYMAGYIENIDKETGEGYGSVMLQNKKNTKHCTVFTYSKDVYGDATIETSKKTIGYNSWFNETSLYLKKDVGFFLRSGEFDRLNYSGIFSYTNHNGHSSSSYGFRCVLIKE